MPITQEQNLLTVRQFLDRHPWATRGHLRALLFDRANNGLDRAVIKVGPRKLLIDEGAFLEWLEQRREAPRPEAN